MKPIKERLPMRELWPMIEESFRQGLTVTLGVTGCSMRPMLEPQRDSVILSPCESTTLRRGALPLCRRADGSFVLHRIIRVQKTTYTLAGDAQRELEHDVPKTCVVAVVTGFVRKGHTVSCRDWRYRLYSTVWMWVRPVRPWLFCLASRLRR